MIELVFLGFLKNSIITIDRHHKKNIKHNYTINEEKPPTNVMFCEIGNEISIVHYIKWVK